VTDRSWRTTQNADDWAGVYNPKSGTPRLVTLLALLAAISMACGYLFAVITH
jgi:hypothetical protein